MGWLSTVIIGIIIAIVARLYQQYQFAINSYRVVHPHQPGDCHRVPLLEHGSEDVELIPGTNYALVSAGLLLTYYANKTLTQSRMELDNRVPISQRGLFLFDFSRPEAAPIKLNPRNFRSPDDAKNDDYFNPHGISIHHSPTHMFVYVINHYHKPGGDSRRIERVEKFELNVSTPTLVHIKTFTDPAFHYLNNLHVVAEDKFYYTNMFLHANHLYLQYAVPLQALFGLPTGNVGYFDGENSLIAVNYLSMPNGIAVTKTRATGKRIVHVTETLSGYLYTYEVADEDGSLRQIAKNFTGYPFLDNINIDELGYLTIAAHVEGRALYRWLGLMPTGTTGMRRAESAVFKVKLDEREGTPLALRELLVEDGTLIDGASAAVTYQGKALLVGTSQDRLLYCRCDRAC